MWLPPRHTTSTSLPPRPPKLVCVSLWSLFLPVAPESFPATKSMDIFISLLPVYLVSHRVWDLMILFMESFLSLWGPALTVTSPGLKQWPPHGVSLLLDSLDTPCLADLPEAQLRSTASSQAQITQKCPAVWKIKYKPQRPLQFALTFFPSLPSFHLSIEYLSHFL